MSNFPYGGKDFSLLISLKQVFLVQKLQVDKWAIIGMYLPMEENLHCQLILIILNIKK